MTFREYTIFLLLFGILVSPCLSGYFFKIESNIPDIISIVNLIYNDYNLIFFLRISLQLPFLKKRWCRCLTFFGTGQVLANFQLIMAFQTF